jgi:hypothetical protein
MSPGNSGCICLSDPHKHIDTTLLFHHYHQPSKTISAIHHHDSSLGPQRPSPYITCLPLWPDFLQFEITTPLLVVGSNNTLEHTADTTVL